MNTTAILETISGYRRLVDLYSKYVEELTKAMNELEVEKNAFEELMNGAFSTHTSVEDFEGTKANLYFEICNTLIEGYSAYDAEVGEAIKTIVDEILKLNQKIRDLNNLISELESQLMAGDC